MGRNEDVVRPVKQRQKRGRKSLAFNSSQVITFSCLFCNNPFETTNLMFDHMREVHPNLCEIPQITAESKIVEEISSSTKEYQVPASQRTIESPVVTEDVVLDKYNCSAEDEDEGNSLNHLIERVASDDELMYEDEEGQKEGESVGEEEEIESPPYEKNSDPDSEKDDNNSGSLEQESNEEDNTSEDSDDYLSLMEPICELNEAETDDLQNKLLESIKANSFSSPPKPGRGRHVEYSQGQSPEGEAFFQCTICNKKFYYAGELARHVRTHTLNKPYQCSICDKSFTHIGSLNTHLRIHRGEKPYKCGKCEKAFTQSSSLMVHKRSHLIKKPISCEICEKGFMNAVSLQLHMKSHQGEEELLSCPNCEKKFKHQSSLLEHLMVHTHNLYQCSICRLQLPTGSDLVQHLKAHTGDKPFQCALCGKSFTQPGSLSTHTRIHTGEKPHQCTECEKSFTQASSLSVHMKIHSPEKPFWCHICERSYSQQAYFNKHMMSYHQEDQQKKDKKFAQCPLCNVAIVDAPKMMVKHFNKYHYEKKSKSFLCSICDEQFEDPQLLIGHVKVHFNVAVNDEGGL